MKDKSIAINEKILLTTREVQELTGIGKCNCLKLVKESGCYIRIGRKILVKRAMFDEWCQKRQNG